MHQCNNENKQAEEEWQQDEVSCIGFKKTLIFNNLKRILQGVDQEGVSKNSLASRKQDARLCTIIKTKQKAIYFSKTVVLQAWFLNKLRNPSCDTDAAKGEDRYCGGQEDWMIEK